MNSKESMAFRAATKWPNLPFLGSKPNKFTITSPTIEVVTGIGVAPSQLPPRMVSSVSVSC